MDWQEIINSVFKVCVIPLLAIAVEALIKFIRLKQQQFVANKDNQLLIKYTNLLTDTITDCVRATNQTYVDALKEQNAFDAEAQKIALQKTYDAVMNILSKEAQAYLSTIYSDLSTYVFNRIESEVGLVKYE